MNQFWRLSEAGPDNLGLACTDDGLLLGRTPLIERRDGRFVVRARTEIEQLLKRAYDTEAAVDRLMPGLSTVASAMNANDPCLARIAAVHLKIPDLPHQTARDEMEAADILIKYARDEGGDTDWNPSLHPRTGTPPNPGWFAPTGGVGDESSPIRIAENDDPTQGSDAPPSGGGKRESKALTTWQAKTRIARLALRRALRIGAFALLRVSAELAANVIPVVGEIADAIAIANIANTISEFMGLKIDAKAALDFIKQGPHTLAELQLRRAQTMRNFQAIGSSIKTTRH
jgi:hypothetical protein